MPDRIPEWTGPEAASHEKRAAVERVRVEIRRRLNAKLAERRPPALSPPPRYDEVFFEGVKWLDSLAAAPACPKAKPRA